MAGFAAPSLLFLNSWNVVERDFMRLVVRRLHDTGKFSRCVEPGAGAFALSSVFVDSGFRPGQIEASDVGLYSSIVGTFLAGDDLTKLDVRYDAVPVPMPHEESADNAAELLVAQAQGRFAAKPRVAYWMELERDLHERREQHVEKVAALLRKLAERLRGLSYRPLSLWDHLEEVKDDPGTIVALNCPSYKMGYERFFDTKGRVTWAQPPYDVWDPSADQARLVAESAEWALTLLSIQLAPIGECDHPDPVYAHDKRRGANDYIWTNKPERVRALFADRHVAIPRLDRGVAKREFRVLPHDAELDEGAEVAVVKLTAAEVRIFKDLWIHRLDFKASPIDLGIIVKTPDRVSLAKLFGSRAIPREAAETIMRALAKMQDDDDVTERNRWQALEYWAAEYLAGG